jgi:hypothetical protein
MWPQDAVGRPPEVLELESIDLGAHLLDWDLVPVYLRLATEV